MIFTIIMYHMSFEMTSKVLLLHFSICKVKGPGLDLPLFLTNVYYILGATITTIIVDSRSREGIMVKWAGFVSSGMLHNSKSPLRSYPGIGSEQ